MSQQPRHGRHARLDEPAGGTPPAPSSSSVPGQRSAPWSTPPVPRSASPSDGAARSLSVGEYVARVRVTDPTGPGFGEWPYGKRRTYAVQDDEPVRDDEPVGPNPYLPCEEAPPEVRLAPGGLPGTLALLAGVTGLGLALFPIIAIAVWPLTILGLVLGVVGLRRVRAGSARNSVAAVTGVLLSTAGLVLCVVWLSMYATAGAGTAEPAVDQGAVPAAVR